MKFLFFLFAATLMATVNEPLRLELFSGYRNDRIHWHLQEYSEHLRDLQYWLNGLTLKAIHRDLTFFLRGAYGTSPSKWCADASGYFGYAVNLTEGRTYKVLLTPLVGYAGYFEKLHPFRMVWNGFFLGAQFTFETGGPLILTAGWAYNMMHTRVHTHIPSGTVKMSSGGNKGQTGWAQIDGCLGPFWRLGLGGELQYLTTRFVAASVGGDTSQTLKLRWFPAAGWVQISRSL